MKRRFVVLLPFLWSCSLIFPPSAPRMDPSPPPQSEADRSRATEALKAAVAALGGADYENVKSEISSGYVVPFIDGQPNNSGYYSFTDFILFPDRERVEFKHGKHRIYQANIGQKGWIYDNESPAIKDQSPDQIADFLRTQRFQSDHLLRVERLREDMRFRYEPRVSGVVKYQAVEAVTFVFPDNAEATIFLDKTTRLPLVVRFPGTSPDGSPTVEETRFSQYKPVGNLMVPFVLEQFVNNQQTNRIKYDKREFNLPVDEKLFVRPTSIKEFK